MSAPFSKFEHFGAIANQAERVQLAQSIYEQLITKTNDANNFQKLSAENFGSAISKILDNESMKELTRQDPALAEKVTLEILEFINRAKREINTSENPFDEEYHLLQSFSEIEKNNFVEIWPPTSSFLQSNYSKNQVNCSFYSQEFEKILESKEGMKDIRSFISVKEHLTEKWQQYLFTKQTKWELSIIDKWRAKFTQDLYNRIEELKKLQQILEPFTSELGRLFDMSKGSWQKGNFEILKHYADLLQKDKELNNLAEMLGKMRQAEKELEAETFNNTSVKPKWEAIHASKSDLIGVIESDDLSSILPSETALLSDHNLESVFIKKFVEKKLQTFEYQAKVLSFQEEVFEDKRKKDKESKGPFIICVDTSGSMHGTPETVAKTLCFAILKIAIRENRKCFLISFSTGVEVLNLRDLKNSLEKILEFLGMSFHGGTDAEPAIEEAIKVLTEKDYNKADVLMITDGVMSPLQVETKASITKVKETGTKFHCLVVGNSANPALLSDFDNNWYYNPNSSESMKSFIEGLRIL